MSTEIKVPVLPESIADAVIAEWYKKPGDVIRRDEVLVDLETDKVILEVPSLFDGVLKKVFYQKGDTVLAEQVLAIIEPADVSAGAGETGSAHDEKTSGSKKKSSDAVQDPVISPSARKLMLENNLTLADISASGKDGRVLKEDVLSAINSREQDDDVELPVKKMATKKITATEKKPVTYSVEEEPNGSEGTRIEKRVPMSRLRARVAERLLQAQHDAAILTTFNEVNLKPIMDLRARYKDKFVQEYDVKLGFMSFFVKASVEALKKHPAVNASIDGSDIVYHGYFDIGVAVSGANGLVVPILKDADALSLAGIEKNILQLANKARENTLKLEEITGGTFTISNGGVFGSMLSTPILNPPQSAILGMHTIKERAMVVEGEIVILPMMYLALSYDHRIIDGREAVQFLVSIKDSLEDPSRMLLGV